MYRMFVDEVGHADLRASQDPKQRYLSPTSAVLRKTGGKWRESRSQVIDSRMVGFPLHANSDENVATGSLV
jgi:hypothetical protein